MVVDAHRSALAGKGHQCALECGCPAQKLASDHSQWPGFSYAEKHRQRGIAGGFGRLRRSCLVHGRREDFLEAVPPASSALGTTSNRVVQLLDIYHRTAKPISLTPCGAARAASAPAVSIRRAAYTHSRAGSRKHAPTPHREASSQHSNQQCVLFLIRRKEPRSSQCWK